MIKSFLEEINKFKNNKTSIFILFIMPVLINAIICLELSGGFITNIPMAVIDYDNSELSRQLVNYFDRNETFRISNYPEDPQEMEKLIKNSRVRTGLIIPKNFSRDVTLLKSPSVVMIYDGSNMSVTSTAKAKASEILLTVKTGVIIKQLMARLDLPYDEAYRIAQAVQYNNRTLYNPSKSFKDFLSPILAAAGVQASIALSASTSVNELIYCEKRRRRTGYAAGKVFFYTIGGTISFFLVVIMQVYFFKITFTGSLTDIMLLCFLLSLAVSASCVFVSSLFKNKIVGMVAGALLFIPNSIMTGATWPMYSMPAGYRCFAKYIPFTHFINNFRAVYLKGLTFGQMANDIRYLFVYAAIVFLMAELSVIFVGVSEMGKEADKNENIRITDSVC